MGRRNGNDNRKTTLWDFLIAFGSGIVNLFKFEKIVCIIILYLIGRDIYFTRNIEKGDIYRQNVLNATDILRMALESESDRELIYIVIIVILAAIVLVLIGTIKFIYQKEIDRLSKERSRLMHDIGIGQYTRLSTHRSSER